MFDTIIRRPMENSYTVKERLILRKELDKRQGIRLNITDQFYKAKRLQGRNLTLDEFIDTLLTSKSMKVQATAKEFRDIQHGIGSIRDILNSA